MSEINIPRDPLSVESSYIPSEKSDGSTPAVSKNRVKDSLEAVSASKKDVLSTQKSSDAPQLETPEVQDDSFLNYFKTISGATLALRRQLSASDMVDQTTRRSRNQAAAIQAQLVANLFEQRQIAIDQLQEEAKQALDEIEKKIAEMQQETKDQLDRIREINSGNNLEQQENEKLSKAYDEYIENLKSIGAVDNGNGNYTVPPEAEKQFREFTQTYQAAVDRYNSYWKGRLTELKQYNNETIAYNQSVTSNNQKINDLINQYNLSDFLKKNGITIPQQSRADLRDLSGYLTQIASPSITPTPLSVSTYPLPSYVLSIANKGPQTIPSIPSVPSIDSKTLYDGIYRELYDSTIAPLDQQIETSYNYWVFLNLQVLFTPVQDTVPDPLLNSKPILKKLLPPFFIDPAKPPPPSSENNPSFTMQAIGVDNRHVEEILGRSILTQAIQDLNLKVLEGQETKQKEKIVAQLVDKLLLFSVGILGNQSLEALFPSLGLLSKSLSSLPSDSPAFAILFATSFANRIQENATQGINADAFQTFINGIPELKDLSASDKTKLVSILNLGQLLVASKLLEENLGLQGMFAQMLPSFSESIDPSTFLQETGDEKTELTTKLTQKLENYFGTQGYTPEEAHFLAEVGTEITEKGLLTPAVTSIPSEKAIDKPLLVNSIKAALLFTDYPMHQADTIAHEAVENTLVEIPYATSKQFRRALETHLQDIGVGYKSGGVAQQAVLVPPKEESLSFFTPPAPTTTREQTIPEESYRGAPLSATFPEEKSTVIPQTKPAPSIASKSPEPPHATPFVASSPGTPLERSTPPSEPPSIPSREEKPRLSTAFTPTENVTIAEQTVASVSELSKPIEQPTVSPLSPKPALSPTQLVALIEKRTLQLFTPQLGHELAKQVSEEIAKTFFGTPDPDSKTVGQVKSPYSLVNVIKNQIQQLHLEENKQWASAVNDSFKETIKTMEAFYAFSLKLMDPLALFVYTGIIYSDQGRKKAIDIVT